MKLNYWTLYNFNLKTTQLVIILFLGTAQTVEITLIAATVLYIKLKK